MSITQCNHDSFMAVYENDLHEKCPACEILDEMKSLENEMRSFIKRCKKLVPDKEGEKDVG